MSCTDDDLNALANGDASKFTMRHAAGEILNLRKSIADSTSELQRWRDITARKDPNDCAAGIEELYNNWQDERRKRGEAQAETARARIRLAESTGYAEDTRTVLGEIVQTCKELHDTRCTDPDELADEIQWIWTVASAVLARTPSLGPSDPQNSGSSLRNEAATTDSAKAVTNQREGAQCVACGDMYKGGPSVLVCPACLAAYEANRAPGEPGVTSTGGAAAAEQLRTTLKWIADNDHPALPADVREVARAALAKNPNPSGHSTAEPSPAKAGTPDPAVTNEDSGPVGLGPWSHDDIKELSESLTKCHISAFLSGDKISAREERDARQFVCRVCIEARQFVDEVLERKPKWAPGVGSADPPGPFYLLAYGGDGFDSRIVNAGELENAYLEIVAGDDEQMRAECATHLADEDEWQMANGERFVFKQSFEDGWLTITRIFERPSPRQFTQLDSGFNDKGAA